MIHRKIEFRGLRESTRDEWVYGFYLEVNGKSYIQSDKYPDFIPVITETVGEFTDIVTIFDDRLFEGEILQDRNGVKYVVQHQSGGFYRFNGSTSTPLLESLDYLEMKSIGNIHENPELIRTPAGAE